MLIVKQNTYPNVELNIGDKVHWEYARGCFYLKRENEIKSCFASPNCNRDGIKPNGKQVDHVGVVGELKSKGYILELEFVK